MKQPVLYEVHEGVATLMLNEAERLNPLTMPVLQGCLEALAQVRADRNVRALIIIGAGRAFCAGADLPDLRNRLAAGESAGAHIGELLAAANPLVSQLRELPVPVVCAVNGAAAGGGVGLALAGDMVVAARSSYFYLPFVPSLGLVPDMGASWAVPRTVGRARALGLALTGHRLSAEQAVNWGLVWSCVDDAKLRDEARALATQLAELPAHAIVEARALFAAAESNGQDAQLAFERSRQQVLAADAAFGEGVQAFAERRKPRFAGRG